MDEQKEDLDIGNVLRRSAEILKEDGWCKGNWHSYEGAHCAIGAIEAALEPKYRFMARDAEESLGLICDSAAPRPPEEEKIFQQVQAVERVFVDYAQPTGSEGDRTVSIPTWNDKDGQTAETVIKTLECVAQTWDEDHEEVVTERKS